MAGPGAKDTTSTTTSIPIRKVASSTSIKQPAEGRSKDTPVSTSTSISRIRSVKELSDESFSLLLKRRENTLSRLAALQRKSLVLLHPIVLSMPRVKTHWDCLLEEMQWMAIDFRQERRFKDKFCEAVASTCVERGGSKLYHHGHDDEIEDMDAETVFAQDTTVQRTTAHAISEIFNDWFRNVDSPPSIVPAIKKALAICSNSSHDDSAASSQPDQIDMESIDKKSKTLLSSSLYSIASDLPVLDSSVSSFLHSHQISAYQAISTVNLSGMGAILFGNSFSGKSFLSCVLMTSWLHECKLCVDSTADAAASSVAVAVAAPAPAASSPSPSPRAILLVTSRRSIVKTLSDLRRLSPQAAVHVWNRTDSPSEAASHETADVVLYALEPLVASMTPQLLEKLNRQWYGVVVDTRGLSEDILHLQINIATHGRYSGKLINLSHWLAVFSAALPVSNIGRSDSAVRRLLLTDSNIVPSVDPTMLYDPGSCESSSSSVLPLKERLLCAGLLSFVCPGVVGTMADQWLQWTDLNYYRADMLPSASYLPQELLTRVNIVLSTENHPVIGVRSMEARKSDQNSIIRSFAPTTLTLPKRMYSRAKDIASKAYTASTDDFESAESKEGNLEVFDPKILPSHTADSSMEVDQERTPDQIMEVKREQEAVVLKDKVMVKIEPEPKKDEEIDLDENDIDEDHHSQQQSTVDGVNVIEEHVFLKMDLFQLRKYISVAEAVFVQSALAGDKPQLLSKAVLLLRRVCFHGGLVTISSQSEYSFLDTLSELECTSIRNENGTSKNRELQPAAEDMDKALSTVLAQPHPADEPPVPDTESTAAVVGLSCAEQEKPCSSSYVVAIPTAGIPLTQVIRIFH